MESSLTFLNRWDYKGGRNYFLKVNLLREFPGDPVVRTLRFHCRGQGFDPWSGI